MKAEHDLKFNIDMANQSINQLLLLVLKLCIVRQALSVLNVSVAQELYFISNISTMIMLKYSAELRSNSNFSEKLF